VNGKGEAETIERFGNYKKRSTGRNAFGFCVLIFGFWFVWFLVGFRLLGLSFFFGWYAATQLAHQLHPASAPITSGTHTSGVQ